MFADTSITNVYSVVAGIGINSLINTTITNVENVYSDGVTSCVNSEMTNVSNIFVTV